MWQRYTCEFERTHSHKIHAFRIVVPNFFGGSVESENGHKKKKINAQSDKFEFLEFKGAV